MSDNRENAEQRDIRSPAQRRASPWRFVVFNLLIAIVCLAALYGMKRLSAEDVPIRRSAIMDAADAGLIWDSVSAI